MQTPPRTTHAHAHSRTIRSGVTVALALLLLTAVLLAGCMGGDDDTDAVSEVDSTAPALAPTMTQAAIPPAISTGEATVISTATQEPTPSPTPAPPTPTATPTDTRVLTLQSALLTLDDLGDGYFLRQGTGDSGATTTEEQPSAAVCNVALSGPTAEVSIERVWERTVNGPFVRQELLWLPDADEAAGEWLRVRRAAARACDDWVAADGSSSQITILRTPIFSNGAVRDSLAVRVVTDPGTGDHPIDLVSIIVVANHVASITTLLDLGADVDQELALRVAEAAYIRINGIADTADGQP